MSTALEQLLNIHEFCNLDELWPYQLIDMLDARGDALYDDTTQRQTDLANGIAFYATMFGEIRSLVSGGDPNHLCTILTVKCPDWSALGWSKDYFQRHFSEQRNQLVEIERDTSKGLADLTTNTWSVGEDISVHVGPNCNVGGQSIEIITDGSDSLTVGKTAIILGLISWSQASAKVFVINAQLIHVVRGDDINRQLSIPELLYPQWNDRLETFNHRLLARSKTVHITINSCVQ
ncbi:hypothetical protein MVEN_00429200 [Mycena venus]|uniref:Uncharacterized protein n=1 Tax=Mycena venus TaxID=2733690 RepID=A0A8H7D7W6_9AGAR|nr:hypothetical protein MVEN_00429200 [Mycena venus]